MISSRLVAMIENRADELTRGLLAELQRNPRTSGYHKLSVNELRTRGADVYRNLGRWLMETAEADIESAYTDLGSRRRQEGIPSSQVVAALVLTKNHLIEYVKAAGLAGSALELYQELELLHLVTQFFDKAVYYTVLGYEQAPP